MQVPLVILAVEDYQRLRRIEGRAVRVRVELNIVTELSGEEQFAANLFGEIPGAHPQRKQEQVLVNAHLDSWAAGTGASNGGKTGSHHPAVHGKRAGGAGIKSLRAPASCGSSLTPSRGGTPGARRVDRDTHSMRAEENSGHHDRQSGNRGVVPALAADTIRSNKIRWNTIREHSTPAPIPMSGCLRTICARRPLLLPRFSTKRRCMGKCSRAR